MGRWRMSGKNWEGRSFTVSAGLVLLLNEIELWDPVKRPSDGTVASKGHDQRSPTSDHRPSPYIGPGVVRAADIGESDDAQGDKLAEALRDSRDSRIKYVIHDGHMFSSYSTSSRKAWEWGPYSGPNGHFTHNHISVTIAADANTNPWNLGLIEQERKHMLPILEGDDTEDQTALADMLNRTYGTTLKLTDPYNAPMVDAVKTHLGNYTGNQAWKAGKGVGGKQYSRLLEDHAEKFGSGGSSSPHTHPIIADTNLGG